MGLVLKRDQCAFWPCKRAFKLIFKRIIKIPSDIQIFVFQTNHLFSVDWLEIYFQKINYAYLLKLRNDI